MSQIHNINPYLIISSDPSWWRRRTALEKTLTIFSLACLLALIVTIVCVISHDDNLNNRKLIFSTCIDQIF